MICTVGVKSRTVPELVALLEAGMTTARFDFSWGSMEYHTVTLNNLREAMKQTKILCATMLDTRGPEIGVQLAPPDVSSFDPRAPKTKVSLEQGNRVTLTTDLSITASSEYLPVNNPDLVHFVEPGDDVFVGQYLFTGSETSSVYLKVDEVDAKAGHIYCTCKNTARLGGVLLTVQVSNKGDDSAHAERMGQARHRALGGAERDRLHLAVLHAQRAGGARVQGFRKVRRRRRREHRGQGGAALGALAHRRHRRGIRRSHLKPR